MAWKRKPQYERMTITVNDRIKGEHVEVERSVEIYEGYRSYGRFSYRGERLTVAMGLRDWRGIHSWIADDYPPPLSRCKTQRAKDWWAERVAG